MTRVIKSLIIFFLLVTPVWAGDDVLHWKPGFVYYDWASGHAIADWLADQLGYEQSFEIPPIYYVTKESLQNVFIQRNKTSYRAWVQEYGILKAMERRRDVLDNIVGLFDDRNVIIFIGNFQDECQQQSILAHELTHYFQFLSEGPVSKDNDPDDNIHFVREMWASQIEERYREEFCQ